jgi:hypothetical protein
VDLLNHIHTLGTIKLTWNPSIHPHGISHIDVLDPDAFRRYNQICPPTRLSLTLPRCSARLRWFQRGDTTGAGGEPEQPADSSRELENSVNQAFRR